MDTLKPHVAIISAQIDSEPLKGFTLVETLTASCSTTNVVVLLDTPERDLVLRAFRSGARGIFCRCDPLQLLSKCVRRVYEKQIWANTAMLDILVEALAEAPVANLVNVDGESLPVQTAAFEQRIPPSRSRLCTT